MSINQFIQNATVLTTYDCLTAETTVRTSQRVNPTFVIFYNHALNVKRASFNLKILAVFFPVVVSCSLTLVLLAAVPLSASRGAAAGCWLIR